jgi:HEAT repeat protein
MGMIEDKDSGTRAAASSTLGDMKARTSIPKLRAALDDKAGEVMFAPARLCMRWAIRRDARC